MTRVVISIFCAISALSTFAHANDVEFLYNREYEKAPTLEEEIRLVLKKKVYFNDYREFVDRKSKQNADAQRPIGISTPTPWFLSGETRPKSKRNPDDFRFFSIPYVPNSEVASIDYYTTYEMVSVVLKAAELNPLQKTELLQQLWHSINTTIVSTPHHVEIKRFIQMVSQVSDRLGPEATKTLRQKIDFLHIRSVSISKSCSWMRMHTFHFLLKEAKMNNVDFFNFLKNSGFFLVAVNPKNPEDSLRNNLKYSRVPESVIESVISSWKESDKN